LYGLVFPIFAPVKASRGTQGITRRRNRREIPINQYCVRLDFIPMPV
jgi:hypothetical protein